MFVAATAAGEPVGVIGFDATMPGAYPLRARNPGIARALLEHVRPLVSKDEGHVYAYIDEDVALEDALCAAGAGVVFRTLRFEGEVPSASSQDR